MITVADDGCGVVPERRELLFVPGQPKASDGNMGIGLSVCRAIVEAHGGTITLQETERGTALPAPVKRSA